MWADGSSTVPTSRPVERLHDLDGAVAGAAEPVLGRPAEPGPVQVLPSPAQHAAAGQRVGDRRGRWAEHRQVGRRQRELGRRGAQVRRQHVGIAGVEHRRLHRLVQQGLRVMDQVGVERVIAGDEHRHRRLALAAGPARLLPDRRPGAGPAGDEHRIQAGDVDPEFQRGRRGEPEYRPGPQRLLQLPAVFGQVAGTVGGHPLRAPLPAARGVGIAQRPPRGQGDRLGAAPGAGEGERPDIVGDQVGQQPRGLLGGAAADGRAGLAAGGGERRFPQPERELAARGGTLGDLLRRRPGEQACARAGFADGGRCEQEHRAIRAGPGLPGPAVVDGDAAHAPQHVADVRAEHPAVAVALIDDHVGEPAEEPVPPAVPGEQHVVQHVRCGDEVGRVRARPFPLGGRRVPVHGRRAHPGQRERLHGAQLVGGERPGRGQVENGAPGQHRGERGQQVPQRLPGRGWGRDDHVLAPVGVLGHGHLMRPRQAHPGAHEGVADLRRDPVRPGQAASRAGRYLRDMDEPPGPLAAAQDPRGGGPGLPRRWLRGCQRRAGRGRLPLARRAGKRGWPGGGGRRRRAHRLPV